MMIRLAKAFSVLIAVLALAACDPAGDLDDPPVDLGNFRLGHNITVVVEDVALLPGTREATSEEWVAVLQGAIDRRFGRYEGRKIYHIALSVRAYGLSPVPVPGVPGPPTALDLHARIWDDALGRMLHDEPKEIQIVDLVKASGIGASKQEQMQYLANQAAKKVEDWLLENPQWFATPAGG